MIGPETAFSRQLHAEKYRADGESFDDYCVRYARATADDFEHFDRHLLEALRGMRLLPAGRQQISVGRPHQTTAYNCFVMGTIPDSMDGIMEALKDSALSLRSGGGIGMDFSTLRPTGDPVRGLGAGAYASGPISFMKMWDGMSRTIMSAGMRRGAMMAVLRCDHPEIRKFVHAKRDNDSLTTFNISVAVTDAFMEAVHADAPFTLRFGGRRYGAIRALDLWAEIMESNWDFSEPGVIFIDRVNALNPLNYCEVIAASNPCSEQMLPPYGACLLGSLNLVKYLKPNGAIPREFDYDLLGADARAAVRAFDNVIDRTRYPLPMQEHEAKAKRRMGLGVTGMANALEIMGHAYGSESYLAAQMAVLARLQTEVFLESARLSAEKGPFPAFDASRWLATEFARGLAGQCNVRAAIRECGLRNGQLLSIAPTGTISLCADNVSAGIEPPYALSVKRKVRLNDGLAEIEIEDYAARTYGVKGRTSHDIAPADHVRVLCAAQRHIDSAISKTCNVRGARAGQTPADGEIGFAEFKELYRMAYEGGAKSCATHNANGKRTGILASLDGACAVDGNGAQECGE